MIPSVNVIDEHAACGETIPTGFDSLAEALQMKAISLKGIAKVFGLSQDCFVNCSDVTTPRGAPAHTSDGSCQANTRWQSPYWFHDQSVVLKGETDVHLRGVTRVAHPIDEASAYEVSMVWREDAIERELREEAALAKFLPKPKKGVTVDELREALVSQYRAGVGVNLHVSKARRGQSSEPVKFYGDWAGHVWRPGDKEQQEGRMVRQGLKLGKGDADGMEAMGHHPFNVVSWGKTPSPEPVRTTKPALPGLGLNMNNERHVYARVNAAHLEDITKC